MLVLLTQFSVFVNRFLHKTDTLFLDARGEAIIFAFVNGKLKMEN